jgi:hypothetical protein
MHVGRKAKVPQDKWLIGLRAKSLFAGLYLFLRNQGVSPTRDNVVNVKTQGPTHEGEALNFPASALPPADIGGNY